jgi:hypothetical protein
MLDKFPALISDVTQRNFLEKRRFPLYFKDLFQGNKAQRFRFRVENSKTRVLGLVRNVTQRILAISNQIKFACRSTEF